MKKRILALSLCCLMLLLCGCQREEPAEGKTALDQYREMVESMKNAVPEENVLMEDDADTVFGSEYLRKNISGIYFQDTMKKIPKDSWDVSREGNGKVKAWVETVGKKLELHIAAKDGVRAPENCRNLFAGYTTATVIDFGGCFETSGAVDMSGMFRGCGVEGVLDLSGFQTSGVRDMSEMFADMSSLETVDLSSFDTSGVTDMSGMFRGYCGTSLDISGFDTSAVTDMGELFAESTLTELDLQNFNTAEVTCMSGMFRGCSKLESLNISSFWTANVRTMDHMFEGCGLSRIDVKKFNSSRVTNMAYMFADCDNLTELDLSGLETRNVETMASMFNGCTNLQKVNLTSFNTEKVTDMSGMFNNCHALLALDLSGFDVSSVEEYSEFMLPGAKVDGKPWETLFSSSHQLTF